MVESSDDVLDSSFEEETLCAVDCPVLTKLCMLLCPVAADESSASLRARFALLLSPSSAAAINFLLTDRTGYSYY